MTAALAVSETIYEVPIADVIPSHIANYRQRKGSNEKMNDLVASVAARGILQPLVLRRTSIGALELVFGYRRLEAARRVDLATVPCVIREYDDEAVHDARLIENDAREDPHPLDQAEAYAAALKRGHSPQAIAEKLGQSVRYVMQRLALNELCSAGQLALEQGYISLDVAVLIARLPGEKVQTDALKQVSAQETGEGLTLVSDARERIEDYVMLDLAEAPFKLDDAELVPAAGPCTTCRKRTGNQTELFGDATSGDLCIDAPCHRSKLDAHYQLRVKQAKVEGVAVVPPKKAREVLDGAYGFGGGELVRLDASVSVGLRDKPVRSLLGKELPPVTIVQDPKTGLTVEMVPRSALKLAQAKAEKAKPAADAQKVDARAKAEREAERLQAEVRRRVMLELIENTEGLFRPAVGELSDQDMALMRALCRAAVHSLPPDTRKSVANRRGCPLTVEQGAPTTKKGKGKHQEALDPEQRLGQLIPTLDASQLAGLLLELLIDRAAPGKWSEAHESYSEACAALGVDVPAHEAAVKLEAKEKAKPQRRAVGLPQPVEGVKSKRKVKHPEPTTDLLHQNKERTV
jgi:ParB/RepB/Spo0J family partition protein